MVGPTFNRVKGTKPIIIIYLALIPIIGFSLYFLLEDVGEVIAATIFLASAFGTLLFWRYRVAIGFLGLVGLLLTRTLTLSEAIKFMDLEIILFLIGMMIIVGQLRHAGFFRWLVSWVLKVCRFNVYLVVIALLVLAGVLAAAVDEITSILITTALVLDFCEYFGVAPVKYIVALIMATNIGSSWVAQGNPICIQIAVACGLTLPDFLRYALPVGVLALFILIPVVLFWLRDDLQLLKGNMEIHGELDVVDSLRSWARINDRRLFTNSVVIFVIIIILLIFDYWLEIWFGYETNTFLVATILLGAAIIKIWQAEPAQEYLQRDIDWRTIIFHLLFFAKTGGVVFHGLVERMANPVFEVAGGQGIPILIVSTLGLSGFLSAVLDNIVVVAIFIPLIENLATQYGATLLRWALLFGATFGGNLTMVGSTANIVALGDLEKKTGFYMTLGYWLKIGIWASLIPMGIGVASLLLFG